MPEFALLAEGGCVANDVLAFIAAAVNLQMRRDVAPVWANDVWTVVALDSLDGVKPNQTRKLLTFKRKLNLPGAAGFHTIANGVEYAEALAPPAPRAGEAIDATTTSHEVIETFADPGCNAYVRGPSGRRLARELADPVESDAYAITVRIGPDTRQVMVSNFVFPAWFDGGPGPYDFLKRVVMPEETTAGGYYTYLDDANHPQQVFADARARQAWLTKMTNPTTRVQARLRDALGRG